MYISNRYSMLLKELENKRNDNSLFLNGEDDQQKGQLEVETKNGYIRKYIKRPDGTRILISESKQFKINEISNSNYSEKPPANQNTAETMQLLNHLLGIGSRLEFQHHSHTTNQKEEM